MKESNKVEKVTDPTMQGWYLARSRIDTLAHVIRGIMKHARNSGFPLTDEGIAYYAEEIARNLYNESREGVMPKICERQRKRERVRE